MEPRGIEPRFAECNAANGMPPDIAPTTDQPVDIPGPAVELFTAVGLEGTPGCRCPFLQVSPRPISGI
jgi:hypothetical protein